jgi:phosphoribosylaminoimidazolecarboxamide formyltransferase/IMP cyclohydrolase
VHALLSVYDKRGIEDFARALIALGFDLISTGGTHAALNGAGIAAQSVSDVTGFPEILDGRVKTLHPRIHAGLLARRELATHRDALEEHEIGGIDLLAVNLYPFEATVSRPGCTLIDALEQIDIGGPAMIRAAAKNFPGVIVITNPDRYAEIATALRNGIVSDALRRSLAAEAFQHVSLYDALVADYLRGSDTAEPAELTIPGRLAMTLRYGENPHQVAGAYHRPAIRSGAMGVLDARQIQGKELSYNNLLDADAAMSVVRGLDEPSCAIVKHTIPCGFAIRPRIDDAFDAALSGDPISAYGGIVAVNRPVENSLARKMTETFFEVIVAPEFTEPAREALAARKNLRLLTLPAEGWNLHSERDVRSIAGGFLVQGADTARDDQSEWSVVTRAEPTAGQLADLAFAWHACRFVKSNAVTLASGRALVGVGPGQPNRVDSVKIAVNRAGSRASGAALASDAFFPFSDGVEVAIAAGIAAVIQPGGSKRDAEVISACDQAGLPMIFTGRRHFRH